MKDRVKEKEGERASPCGPPWRVVQFIRGSRTETKNRDCHAPRCDEDAAMGRDEPSKRDATIASIGNVGARERATLSAARKKKVLYLPVAYREERSQASSL